MSPRKEAMNLVKGDVIVVKGDRREVEKVDDFANRIVVTIKDGGQQRYNAGDEVEVI